MVSPTAKKAGNSSAVSTSCDLENALNELAWVQMQQLQLCNPFSADKDNIFGADYYIIPNINKAEFS